MPLLFPNLGAIAITVSKQIAAAARLHLRIARVNPGKSL